MSLKILQLNVRRIQRVTAVEITPTGELVKIQGRNAQGKSTILRSIAMLFGGKKEWPEEPVRRGDPDGEILATIGEGNTPAYVVRLRITAEGRESLTVTDAEGNAVPSPTTFLKGLVNLGLAFNPVAFAQADAKTQGEMLRKVTGLDFADLEAERERVYRARTAANLQVAAAEAALRSLPAPKAGLPDVPVSAVEMMASLETAAAEKRENDRKRSKIVEWKHELDKVRALVNDLTEKLRAATAEADELRVSIAEHQPTVDALQDPDVAGIRARIVELEATNAAVRARDAHAKASAELRKHAEQSAALTRKIEDIDAERRSRIAAAQMPVEGLGFDADGAVTYGGLPLSQASSAERIRVSTAIAVAGNARAKIALIEHGNDLDSESLEAVGEIVRAAGATCWIERVTDGDGDGWCIEDGMLKSAPALQTS